MNINPTDRVLHFSFDDEAFARTDVFCGKFSKRQIADKPYEPLDVTATRLPFEDKSFDLIQATNVLGYVQSPEIILNEIKRIGRRAHLKEHSEFAEMLFGWEQSKWVINIENKQLIIKSKNAGKFGRFGPLFHALYANDPVFFDYCNKNPGVLNISVDWFEEDEKENVQESNDKMFEDVNLTKKLKTIFRPCQTEYFDSFRQVLGEVTDKIDISHLKNTDLS